MFVRCLVCFSCAVLCVLFSLAIIVVWKRELIDLLSFPGVFGLYCSVALPEGAVGWSAVCDCSIS